MPLARTALAQPALVIAAAAGVARLGAVDPKWRERTRAVCGFSVGELSALHVAGGISLAQALQVAHWRALAMQAAADAALGAEQRLAGPLMATLLGAEPIDIGVAEQCAADAGVAIACINAPRSITLSGEPEALQRATARATADGWAKRVLPLSVSAPFHHQMMAPVVDDFRSWLRRDNMLHLPLELHWISNQRLNATSTFDSTDDIANALADQGNNSTNSFYLVLKFFAIGTFLLLFSCVPVVVVVVVCATLRVCSHVNVVRNLFQLCLFVCLLIVCLFLCIVVVPRVDFPALFKATEEAVNFSQANQNEPQDPIFVELGTSALGSLVRDISSKARYISTLQLEDAAQLE